MAININAIRYPDLKKIAAQNEEKKAAVNKLLKTIDDYPNKIQYARIQILDWEENETPVGTIEGRVTGGNINLSGTSTVRRNGSLSLIISEDDTFYEVDKIDNLLSLNKKVKIEIGFDITEIEQDEALLFHKDGKNIHMNRIWFPCGVFVIKNPSLNRSLSGLTLSLTLSDKMCLLNGEMGGNFPAAVVFSEIDAVAADGSYTKEYPLVKDIVETIITQYGGVKNYSITGIDSITQKVINWAGDVPLYKYSLNGSLFLDTSVPSGIHKLATYQTGENIGTVKVPFTWPGTALSANIGETITSVLDKIKTLQDYEYFFDIDGTFVWQKKKTYTYTTNIGSVTPDIFFGDNIDIILPNGINRENIYNFTDAKNLVISYSNSPQYNNIKNDFIIWGKRKTSSGAEVPIRYHLAFDEPIEYNNQIDTSVEYYKYLIAEPDIYGFKVVINGGDYIEGITPDLNKYYTKNGNKYIYDAAKDNYVQTEILARSFSTGDNWRTLLYFRGKRAEAAGNSQMYFDNPFYKDLEIEWPKLYDMETNQWRSGKDLADGQIPPPPDGDSIDYFCHIISSNNYKQFQRNKVGRYLTKVLNDTNINCVYFQDIGNNILLKLGEAVHEGAGASAIIRVSDAIYNQIYAGGSQNSAFEQARQLICQNLSYANTISISCIPIYYLEPNNIIKVNDEQSGILGDYVINTISMPLAYNGNMTISASSAITIS